MRKRILKDCGFVIWSTCFVIKLLVKSCLNIFLNPEISKIPQSQQRDDLIRHLWVATIAQTKGFLFIGVTDVFTYNWSEL